MLNLILSSKFKKDRRLCIKRGYNMELLNEVVNSLLLSEKLLPEYKDHQLKGEYVEYRECHIQNDWILIYSIDKNDLYLYRTGTHSDILKI